MLTRQVLAETIGLEIPELLAATGISADDSAGNLKGAIDQALRAMGRTTATLPDDIADADEMAAIALTTLYALKRVQRSMADSAIDSTIDGPNVSLKDSQRFANLLVLIADAEVAALPYIVVGTVSAWGVGSIPLGTYTTEDCFYE